MNEQDQTAAEQAGITQAEAAETIQEATIENSTAAAAPAQKEHPHHGHRVVFETQTFFTIIIFSIFVTTFIVQAFQIPSSSMENTLLIGDFLLVDKMHFAGGGKPGLLPYEPIRRGDIIVFYYPVDPSQFLVKRVIGMPGDHIRLHDKVVYVNDKPLDESYVIHKQLTFFDRYRDNFPSPYAFSPEMDRRWRYQLQRHIKDGELVVPPDNYFAMGDNRDLSLDSRYWGFVPRANIVGRPLVIYLSVRSNEQESSQDDSNDKLNPLRQIMAHLLQMARWGRMFHVVR
ncbi:MAG TPA: signal peptidase I [Candidatus Angelobacter sp.]|nr:signal peptidase I [Candidatus Angelobacter sp.]